MIKIIVDGYEIELNKVNGSFNIDIRAPCESQEVSEGECPHKHTRSVDLPDWPGIHVQCNACNKYRDVVGWIRL